MITLDRIVVPTDFSKCSERARSYACEFAKRFEAEIHLLHVVAPLALPEYAGPIPEELLHPEEGARQELEKWTDPALEHAKSVTRLPVSLQSIEQESWPFGEHAIAQGAGARFEFLTPAIDQAHHCLHVAVIGKSETAARRFVTIGRLPTFSAVAEGCEQRCPTSWQPVSGSRDTDPASGTRPPFLRLPG